jgi:hypothetical protein
MILISFQMKSENTVDVFDIFLIVFVKLENYEQTTFKACWTCFKIYTRKCVGIPKRVPTISNKRQPEQPKIPKKPNV